MLMLDCSISAQKGVNYALIEAGPGIVTSILAADAVDRIYWAQSEPYSWGECACCS